MRLRVPRPLVILWDWTKSVGATVLIFLVLRTFVMEGFHIPSGSMERTLLVGDWLFVNKALYGAEVPFIGARLPAIREPALGEIVVFDSKEDDNKVVKRLVGMPGDTLEMRAGHLYRNGAAVPEPYAIHIDTTRSAGPFREQMREWLLCCNPSPYTFPLLLDGLSQALGERPTERANFMNDVQSAMRSSKLWAGRR